MDEDATWYASIGLGSGHILCYMGTQLFHPRKGARLTATFRPMSIVAKRSPICPPQQLLSSCCQFSVMRINYSVETDVCNSEIQQAQLSQTLSVSVEVFSNASQLCQKSHLKRHAMTLIEGHSKSSEMALIDRPHVTSR